MPFSNLDKSQLDSLRSEYQLVMKENGEILKCSDLWQEEFSSCKNFYDSILTSSLESAKDLVVNREHNLAKLYLVNDDEDIISVDFRVLYQDDTAYLLGIRNGNHENLPEDHLPLIKIRQISAFSYHKGELNLNFEPSFSQLLFGEIKEVITFNEFIESFDQSTEINSLFEALFREGKYIDTEVLLKRSDEEIWVQLHVEPLEYNGSAIYAVGILTDISQRKRLYQELLHSKKTQYLALKGIKSGIFDHDLQTDSVFYSESFKSLLELPENSYIPEPTYRKLIHPKDRDDAYQRHLTQLQGTSNYYRNHYRLEIESKGYRYHDVYGWIEKDEQGNSTRLIGNLIDVHERVVNEKAVATYQNRLEAMINNGFTFNILLDLNGNILTCDKASRQIIRESFNVDPLEEQPYFGDVMPRHFTQTFKENFSQALKGISTHKEIERVLDKGIQWLDLIYKPILNEDEEVIGVIMNFLDITERKKAIILSVESRIKAEELNQLKSDIIANLSHEIRTPLNGIVNLTHLLQQSDNLEEMQELLSYQAEANQRLMETLDNLQSLNEVNLDNDIIEKSPVDINNLIKDIYHMYEHKAQSKKIDLDLNLCKDNLVIDSNSNLLRTAIINVMDNAIKFTNHGEVSMTSFDKANHIEIDIRDTGIGISPSSINRIFDSFIQESTGENRSYEGAGVGLSIAKRYINMLNGQIKVQSSKGKGSIFSIELPKTS
ncbi:hypothetical protein GCM10009117_23310 [Gangjinia marincola]|uniref:histidine kinase n=1 Tax=Gangjinia marincola TaxID=578463 RepID=A0ABP3XUV6_9FLAO